MNKKVEVKLDYIIDVIIKVKNKRFNEHFTTLEEVEIIKELIEKRMLKNNIIIKFINSFSKRNFSLINNILIKLNGEYIQYDLDDIMKIVCDEKFIYLCLCEIIVNKLNNSIEHNCLNCSRECSGNFSYSNEHTCFRWKYDFEEETKKSLRKYL